MGLRNSLKTNCWENLSFVKIALIMFVLHIPYLIVYYPGLMIWDTSSSIMQFYGLKTNAVRYSPTPDALLSNHHMILLTFVFGIFVKIGELLGNQNIGFFIYILFQVALVSCVTSYAIITLKNHFHKSGTIFLFLWFGFFPAISLWQIAMSKDAIYSIAFLLFIILLFKFEISNGKILENKRFILLTALTCLCLTLTKQQGIYIVLITAFSIMLTYRKQIWRILYTFLLPSLLYQIVIVSLLLPNIGVAASGKQETLGFMFQQTALTVIEHGDTITEEEKNAIEKVLPYDELPDLYSPSRQDPVKFQYKQTANRSDRTTYIFTWIKMFFKYPGTYFKATFLNCRGYFLPEKTPNNSFLPGYIEETPLTEHSEFKLHTSGIPFVRDLLDKIFYKINSIPIINSIFSCYLYVWAGIVFCFAFVICKKRFVSFLCPIILTVLLCIISPVICFRYILPLVLALPFLFFSFSENWKKPK